MTVQLKDRNIENYARPYLIAEIGANHNGDMDLARRMIDSAKECGADAVKFQSWTPESLISQEEYERNQTYTDSPKKHFGTLREMVEAYALTEADHHELSGYCEEIGIDFCSTPFSKREIDLLVSLQVPFIKIASMDIDNYDLLEYAGATGRPILLSTGMATLAEVEEAIRVLEATGNRQMILLHCISVYPPRYEEINLRNIQMLKRAFGYPVGFSDHTMGTSIPLASVGLGAAVIEKHFTIDKDLPGWDHEISADPAELRTIAEQSKNILTALGSYRRTVSEAEEAKKQKFRRSLVTTEDIPEGTVLQSGHLSAKRPGTAIPPSQKRFVIGRTTIRTLQQDELLHWKDLI